MPSSTSSVRAFTPAAREVFAPSACLSMSMTFVPLSSNDAARVRPVGPAPTMSTSVWFMEISSVEVKANACWYFHRAP
jgi:hypothetical protein